jgi:nitroimidazol reductase NimA-like FMN-containing flavoprotein (pyridoxamine 5'-phosphate oxidase superfamily)
MLGTLNREQIDHVLRTELVGRIGCHDGGRTYIVPITYAYDGGHIYGHSAAGLKVRMMRADPHVCFEVDHMVDMANGQRVIAWGVYEELHGDDATEAMRYLIDRVSSLMASETSLPSHGLGAPSGHQGDTAGHEAVIYRITLTEKTGRFEQR